MAHFLVVSAKFYDDLADELRKGALGELIANEHTYDEVEVPGALEIPLAIRLGIETGKYDGCVALGTVIRGETGHYDIVAIESSRALMNLSLQYQMPIGNGILTVEDFKQAWARASTNDKNKGGGAAQAAMHLAALKTNFRKAS